MDPLAKFDILAVLRVTLAVLKRAEFDPLLWLTTLLWVNAKESQLFSKRFMSFQPTSTNWLLSINCSGVWDSFTISEVSDSPLYLKWHFLFQGTLIQALLSLYLKGCFDHHCLHASHNAEKMLHRLGLCCSFITRTIFKHSCLTNASAVQSIQMASCSLQLLEANYLCLNVEMERGFQQLLASAFRMGWKPLSGNTDKSSVWAVEDNGPAVGRNDNCSAEK